MFLEQSLSWNVCEKMMFGKSCFRLFGKSSVIWNFCNKIFSVQSFFLDITFSRIHESKKLRYKRIVFRWLHAIILKFNSSGLVWRQLSDLAKKINSNLHPVFTSKKLLMRSKWENPNHLLLINNALLMNTKCDLCDAGCLGYRCQ